MALTDENGGGLNVSMPVAPMGYGGNYGGGYGYGIPFFPMMGGYGNGGFGGDWAWILLLLVLGGNGWGGFGGFGGFGGGLGIDFPWLLNGQNQINANTNSGFDHAATQTALGNLSTAVTSGFGDVQTSLCSGFAGVNATVNNAQNALSQQLYTNEIASLNRSFAEQTANTQAINGVSSQLAKCCCDNELATTRLQGVIQVENAADRAAVSDGIRDVLTATNAQTQRILDKLCDQELAAAQRENNELRTRLNMADLAASQAAQTAALVADNTAQTQYIVNRVAPYPVPSYNVPAPYGYGYGPGYGYGYGGNFGFNPFGNVGFGNGSF